MSAEALDGATLKPAAGNPRTAAIWSALDSCTRVNLVNMPSA